MKLYLWLSEELSNGTSNKMAAFFFFFFNITTVLGPFFKLLHDA